MYLVVNWQTFFILWGIFHMIKRQKYFEHFVMKKENHWIEIIESIVRTHFLISFRIGRLYVKISNESCIEQSEIQEKVAVRYLTPPHTLRPLLLWPLKLSSLFGPWEVLLAFEAIGPLRENPGKKEGSGSGNPKSLSLDPGGSLGALEP